MKFTVSTVGLLGALVGMKVVSGQDSASVSDSATASATDSVVSSGSASSTASSSAASPSATAVISSAMIPSGISNTCSTYLSGLNTDGAFAQCVEPLYQLTSAFNPSTGYSADNVTSTTITSTLTPLCASSAKCSDNLIRSYLGQFYASCGTELTPGGSGYSDSVRELYDYLYVLNPFRSAVCARDSGSQKYCVLEIASQAAAVAQGVSSGNSNGTSSSNSTTGAATNNYAASLAGSASALFAPVIEAAENLVIYTPVASLTKRFFALLEPRQSGGAQQVVMTPNATTYRTTSLPYLFLQPDMSEKLLCATCTKSVMAAYIAWESQTPYALGLSSSPILGGQQTLWNAIQGTCGTNFTDSITALAGVLASNSTQFSTGAAGRAFEGEMGLKGVLGGLLVAGAASLFAGMI